MEQPAVQQRLKPPHQTLQLERVSRSEFNLDPTVVGLLSGDRQGRHSHPFDTRRQYCFVINNRHVASRNALAGEKEAATSAERAAKLSPA